MITNLLPKVFYILAKVCINLNLPLKAIAYLETALQYSPQNKELYFSLARAYQILGRWDDLFTSLEKVKELYPDDLNIYWRIGILAFDIRRGEKALSYLLYCYSKTPKTDKVLLARRQALLGASYILVKDWVNAEKHLTRARLLAPWDLDACSATIQLYYCTKRHKDILGFVDNYINEYSTLYPFFLWKGNYFQYTLRQPEKSLEFYRLALRKILYKKARDFCDAYAFTNNMFDEILDRYLSALVACDRSLTAFSEILKYEKYKLGSKIAPFKRRLLLYVITGKFDEAEILLSSLSQRIKESAEILNLTALLRNKQGEFFKAKEIIEKAISMDKDYIESYETLGEIQINLKRWHEALETYTYLSNRTFYTAFVMKKIGVCHFHLNELEKAVEYYKEALEHDEFDAEVWVKLGDAYSKQGERELAVSAYQKGLTFDWLDNEKRQYAEGAIKDLS